MRAQQGMALATIAEAEIRRFGPPGQVLVEPSAVLTVAFEDSGTVTGEGVIGTLRAIRGAVADVLVHLEPYIGIV